MASETPNLEDPSAGDGYKGRGPWILRILVGLVVVAVGAYLLLRPANEDGRASARKLPNFELPLLTGGGTLSNADLQGKPVVINFWASWCGPCRQETPLLQEKWEKYEAEGILILGVDVKDTEQGARDFVEEFGVTYPVVVDREQTLFNEIAPVDGLPQTFFVDETGRFLERADGSDSGSLVLGAIEEAELEAQIQKLLEGAS
jgi:cytochrome c biogenesis protein CcmG/thiol:disulfide interchange protein DsbE